VMDAVKSHFKPRFINRVDELCDIPRAWNGRDQAIVDIQVKKLEQRLLERQIRLKMTEKAKEWLAKKGFDPAYGPAHSRGSFNERFKTDWP